MSPADDIAAQRPPGSSAALDDLAQRPPPSDSDGELVRPTPWIGPTGSVVDTDPDDGLRLMPPVTRSAVLANARALIPLVAAEADEVEAGAHLTARLAAAMRAAGVFQMAFPARLGGLELGITDQLDVVALISAADASAGWHVGVLNATGYYASRLGERAYAQLYPSRDMPTSGSFHPRGQAVQVDGGYLVTGQWDWGSAADIAEHVVGGCLVVDDGGRPVAGAGGQMHLGLWLPRTAVRSAGNWQTVGLRGTGSASFFIDEPAFVPIDHSFDREAGFDPAADPLNRTPLIAHFALGGVVLGLARHAVALAADALRQRPGGRDSAASQSLGEVVADVDLAYAGVREIGRRTDDLLFGGTRPFTALDEARMTAANAASAAMLRRILPVCMELVGSYYILDTHPMQRVIRDAVGALAHSGTRRAHLGMLGDTIIGQSSGGDGTMPGDPLDWDFWVAGRRVAGPSGDVARLEGGDRDG